MRKLKRGFHLCSSGDTFKLQAIQRSFPVILEIRVFTVFRVLVTDTRSHLAESY